MLTSCLHVVEGGSRKAVPSRCTGNGAVLAIARREHPLLAAILPQWLATVNRAKCWLPTKPTRILLLKWETTEMAADIPDYDPAKQPGSSFATEAVLELVVEGVHTVDATHAQVAFVHHPTIYGIRSDDPDMHDLLEVLHANVGKHVAVRFDPKTAEIKSVRAIGNAL
jgi:hypothetical protein